jgi:hypothetical protein
MIWGGVPKPHVQKETPLSDFFQCKSLSRTYLDASSWYSLYIFDIQMQVVALNGYEEK